MTDQHASPPTMGDLTSKKGWVRIKYDQFAWIPVLPVFPDGHDLESYSATAAEEWWQMSGLRHAEVDVLRLRHLLIAAHADTFSRIPCHLAFMHLPDPRQMPLMLYVGVWEATGDRDEQLRMWCLASDPGAVERPVIEQITTDRLGTGIRVMRYRHHDDGALYAALRYAWRSEEFETDLVLNTAAEDLGRLRRAIPDIDDFANATSIISRAELRN
jgi:hypothetical protein